jgi:hypothetical protein
MTGFPIMILLFAAMFWITITGANVPSGMVGVACWWIAAIRGSKRGVQRSGLAVVADRPAWWTACIWARRGW